MTPQPTPARKRSAKIERVFSEHTNVSPYSKDIDGTIREGAPLRLRLAENGPSFVGRRLA